MKFHLQLLSLALLLIPILGNAQKVATQNPATAEFMNSTDGLHYAIIRLTPIKGKLEETIKFKHKQLEEDLTQMNTNNSNPTLRFSQIYLSGKEKIEPVITVRRFDGYLAAKAYCQTFAQDLNSLTGSKLIVEVLPISQINYRTCLKKKSAKGYKKYYTEVLEKN